MDAAAAAGFRFDSQLRLGPKTVKFYQSVNYVYRAGRACVEREARGFSQAMDNFLNLCRHWQLPRATKPTCRHTKKKKKQKIEKNKKERLSVTEVGRHHLSHMCAHKFSTTCGTHTHANTRLHSGEQK